MVSTTKNEDGFITAYAEWQVLDKAGRFKKGGDCIYVQNIWIHEKYREDDKTFEHLVRLIDAHPYGKSARFVYWEIVRDIFGVKIIDEVDRTAFSRRITRPFKREYILNKILKKGRYHVKETLQETVSV